MGTYGETVNRATLPTTSFQAVPMSAEGPTFVCDQCVARSVAVIVVTAGESTMSLEFCAHHLARHTAKLTDQGHEVHFHE